jgi:hypothetical protein
MWGADDLLHAKQALYQLSYAPPPVPSRQRASFGAYTELQDIRHPDYSGYTPLATQGALCPQSRTSVPWDRQWPIQPDLVLEGGNFATQAGNPHATAIDDLQLLSTNADFLTAGPLTSFGFTSGATAQAARMCASIAAMYPQLWPETIRGLIVLSASHTPEMRNLYSEDDMAVRRAFLARFGHGVPDLQRALWSLQHNLTLVIEGETQPFTLGPSGAVSNEVIYFDLPWPTDVLQDERYYGSDAQLRITLSYFVEANAARRGFSGRYRYASHGLRFAVRRPGELPADFRKRVNDLERDDGYSNGNEGEKGWFIKSQVRNRGSLIQDTWTGSAAELADRGTIAIYPIGGWWKTINPRRNAERKTRFSLPVSLSLADSTADLYTPIKLQVEALEI